jgi:hypothetical protein
MRGRKPPRSHLHGAINVKSGEVSLLITKEWT